MRLTALMFSALALAGCASWGPVSARQREQAQYDTPRDHPHPPGLIVGNTASDNSFSPLRCWNNAPEIVCSR